MKAKAVSKKSAPQRRELIEHQQQLVMALDAVGLPAIRSGAARSG